MKRLVLHSGLFTSDDAAPACHVLFAPYTATRLKTWRIMSGGCKADVQLTAAHTNIRCSSTCLSVVRRHDAPFGGEAAAPGPQQPPNPNATCSRGAPPKQLAANSHRRQQPSSTVHHWPSLLQKLMIVYTVVVLMLHVCPMCCLPKSSTGLRLRMALKPWASHQTPLGIHPAL